MLETLTAKAPVLTSRVEGNYGEFVLEPLERGFGVTLGNPLRRILMSSIPGTAVTSVYIEDALHEFATLPGIKEDVVQIVLNLKELIVKFHEPGSKTLLLRAEGPGEVYARDLVVPSSAELVNPDLYIATLGEDAKLVMEVRVDEGVGYVAAEKHGIKDRINSIPVDALFSPIKRVAFHVEDTRLGQRTDLDKLILRIWTDGSVTPDAALAQAVEILRGQLGYFDQLAPQAAPEPEAAEAQAPEAAPAEPEEAAAEPGRQGVALEDLGLSTRVLHNLREEGIDSVANLTALTERELKKVPGIGERSVEEIKERLAALGLALKE
ncbi:MULTISPECIES: DNA-directed RNA polymerase subunit alpha [Oceanithermus]|uniref:DNA-directed RNA polymerase subunit alpha n=2 Tax=Oceanithermus desulfurans TaxID=227924 RepID=A0A511RN92_9DEIN|nr:MULTISPECIES: DNA-directed RNA polymerase subunit alpha [Oceanithermus]MBB6028681.1 DNA-directed RNA polymerase subunit alpha [Oceanithermus desulfurans]GEM90276.1 DNA-directed RNA polymerase subunit alpha [Oceanithermus desulfurans NBRC 100063]